MNYGVRWATNWQRKFFLSRCGKGEIPAVGAARRHAIEKPDGGIAFSSMLTATLPAIIAQWTARSSELLAAIKMLIETPLATAA